MVVEGEYACLWYAAVPVMGAGCCRVAIQMYYVTRRHQIQFIIIILGFQPPTGF
jgi:hypothetical protein